MKKLIGITLIGILFITWSLTLGSYNILMEDWLSIFNISDLIGIKPNTDLSHIIFYEIRLPRLLIAIVCGVALSLSGLWMQNYFQNPLAGPFVLGISSGASLGVAVLGFLSQYVMILGEFTRVSAAALGAIVVFIMILIISKKWKNPSSVLIFGIMISYLSGALITLMIYYADSESIKRYTLWGMGNFESQSYSQIFLFALVTFIAWIIMLKRHRHLDNMAYGKEYAMTLGTNYAKEEKWVLICSCILAAWATALCGPIAFIGLMAPHFTRMIFKVDSNLKMMILTPNVGWILTVFALDLTQAFEFSVPINTATSLMGAPFVIWFLWKKQRI